MGIRRHLIGTLTALLLVGGCTTIQDPTAGVSPSAAGVVLPTQCWHAHESVDFGPYVIAGVTEHGTLPWYPLQSDAPDAAVGATVVVAEVVGSEPGVFNTPDGSPPAGSIRLGGADGLTIMTPVWVRVERVIRGEAERGDLRILIEGGTAGCSSLWVDVAPRLLIGHRYVLFLYPSRTSDRAVHVDRLELKRDAWPIDADDVVSTPNGPMSLTGLATAIDRVAASAGP